MAKLTHDEVLHVAKLAKLPLSNEEVDLFSKQLSDVVNYFDELNEVDTEKIEATHQTTGLSDILREDTVDETRILAAGATVSEADKIHNNMFVVPYLLTNK